MLIVPKPCVFPLPSDQYCHQCDQKRPACDRCTKTGRSCEGYDRPDKKTRVSRAKSQSLLPMALFTYPAG